MMKRIIVVLIALCLSFNGVFFKTNAFAQCSDEYSHEMLNISKKLLTKLGAWDEDKPNDGYITRAEIAKIISIFYGGTEEILPIPEKSKYNDVPLEHWACRWIEHVYAPGYWCIETGKHIRMLGGDGNGNFRPDDYITYQEFAKVLVVFTYWYPYVEYVAKEEKNNKSIYPDLFYEIARLIGLYPLEETKKTAYVTQDDAAILLYNALNIGELHERSFGTPAEYIQTNYNRLSRMNISTVRGYAKVLDENKVLIDGVEYIGKVDSDDFREGLVICFYKWNDFHSKEGDIKPIVFCHPISSLDFDNQKPISDSIPKMFEERYLVK